MTTISGNSPSRRWNRSPLTRCSAGALLTLALLVISASADDVPAHVVDTAYALQLNLNAFCLDMWRTYNDDTEEFYDAYREAYELLQISKKITATLQSGRPSTSLAKWALEIDSEIHHVEHHLGEFAERPGIPEPVKQRVFARLEQTEESLGALMAKLGVEEHHAEGHDHDDHDAAPPAKADMARAAITAEEFQARANALATWIQNDHNDQSEGFFHAYRESFQLFLDVKRVNAGIKSGTPAEALAPLTHQLDARIHAVESQISAFAKLPAAPGETDRAGLLKHVDELEQNLHALLGDLGLKGDGGPADPAEHDHAATIAAQNSTAEELASDLAIAANSLARALEHNYQGNTEFPEAYNEIVEFKEVCKQVAQQVQGDQLSDEARQLVTGLDGELHHLEEHVDHFVRDDDKSLAEFGRAKRKLTEVEGLLHALMKRAQIERTHVD